MTLITEDLTDEQILLKYLTAGRISISTWRCINCNVDVSTYYKGLSNYCWYCAAVAITVPLTKDEQKKLISRVRKYKHKSWLVLDIQDMVHFWDRDFPIEARK